MTCDSSTQARILAARLDECPHQALKPAPPGTRTPVNPAELAVCHRRPVEVADDLVRRSHRLPSGLEYTTTTGRVVFRREETSDGKADGFKPKAEIFLTAYTAQTGRGHRYPEPAPGGLRVQRRPGFILRVAASGPARARASWTPATPGTSPLRPFGLVDNPQTLLEHADLVMIDPVNTGFSRVVDGNTADEFHAFEQDRDLVAEVIRLWTTRNNRWLSPKYLVGESYGTLRAVAVAGRLFDAYGMSVNGLGLISTVLNLGTLTFAPGVDTPYALHLPTYAAIALLPRAASGPGAGGRGPRG